MKITFGYDRDMEKSLIECCVSDNKRIIVIHFLGISIGIFRCGYENI